MTLRRTRRSAQQWAELVGQFKSSDETQEAFCLRLGLGIASFQKYCRRLSRNARDVEHAKARSFVDVTPRSAALSSAMVTMHAGSDLRVECPVSMGVEALAQLVRVIRNGR